MILSVTQCSVPYLIVESTFSPHGNIVNTRSVLQMGYQRLITRW